MPIDYRIDAEAGVVYTTAAGVLSDDDVLAHKARLSADPDFAPHLVELSDVRAVTDLQVTPRGVAAFAGFDAEASGPRRLAIVTDSDLIFGFARMYEQKTEADPDEDRVGVFRTIEEARAWLGLGLESEDPPT